MSLPFPMNFLSARLLALVVAIVWDASSAMAVPDLALPPEARQTLRQVTIYDTYALPIGPWEDGRLPSLQLKGTIEEVAWRIPGSGNNPLKLAETLTETLKRQGYIPVFSCETDGCGGFDFRYDAPVLPEPQMHVDLGNFRYVALVKGSGELASYASLLISRAGETGFVQLTRIGGAGKVALPEVEEQRPRPTPGAPPQPHSDESSEPADLEDAGRLVLEDVGFASGSAELRAGSFSSLQLVAAYLAENPDRTIVIVGHTDAVGTLAANIAVSKSRAQSVMSRLISDYGANPEQLSAEGVGFLAPRATNLTEEGRARNRRVEAVLSGSQ